METIIYTLLIATPLIAAAMLDRYASKGAKN